MKILKTVQKVPGGMMVIPLLLGVVLNTWVSGWMFTPEILLGGLASGLASTGAFELVRNVAAKKEDM